MKKLFWFIKCFFMLGSIKDGSICWFSKHFWNVHDYPKHKGGNGLPFVDSDFICPNCQKPFTHYS